MYYLVFISLLDQSCKTISVIQKLKSARVRTHQKRPLQVSYWKLVLISCVFPLKVQESCPFRKTVGINWNVQHVRLTKRGLKFSNNPDGSAYQPKKGSSRGEDSWEFLVAVCCPVLQILTRFQTKKCNFPYSFSDQSSKLHTRFHTWPLGGNYVIITYIRAQTNKLIKPFRIRIFLFRSYSFGIETINTFIHCRSSPENLDRFKTKMGRAYTRFQTKTAQKPDPMGQHIPIWLI